MKRIPYVTSHAAKTERITSVFGGINQSVVAGDGEFADMENMSCRDYPAISTREKRRRSESLLNFLNTHGMHYMEGVLISYGTSVWYSPVSGVMPTTNVLSDTKKGIVDIGNKFIVWPDKKSIKKTESRFSQELLFENLNISAIKSNVMVAKEDDGISLHPAEHEFPFDGLEADDTVLLKIKETSSSTDFEVNSYYTVTEVHKTTYMQQEHVDIIKVNCTEWPFTQQLIYFTANSLHVYRYVPDFDYVVEANNRVWGCRDDSDSWPDGTEISGSQIQCCKLGDPKNWFSYVGTSMDAYAATIGGGGKFTGAINYCGNPVFMKKDRIITIYGEKPSNFSTVVKEYPGAKYNDSMVVIKEILYYVSSDGVYAYNGVSPTKISEKIKEEITEAVATQYDGRYYLSCKLGGSPCVLVYDPEKGIWDIEEKEQFASACYGEGQGYVIEGVQPGLYSIGGGTVGSIDWMLESVDMREDSIDMKYISKLKFNVWLDSGSEATIYMKYDDSPLWERVGDIKSTTNKTYVFPIIPKRCNKFRWKLEGKGNAKLLAVGRTVEGGSELNGNV